MFWISIDARKVVTIEYLLDNYELLIKIDYESELDNNEIWYLYLASEEETKKYLSLRDIDKILLKILINHDTNGEIGQIRYDYVKSLLEEKGFSERELRRLWIDDITDFVWKTENGERVQWCYLVPEWEKTDSYKAARAKATERALEKESKWRLEDYERESHEKP